ncbi:unnamed protein product, partial [Urochloa humidicola]
AHPHPLLPAAALARPRRRVPSASCSGQSVFRRRLSLAIHNRTLIFSSPFTSFSLPYPASLAGGSSAARPTGGAATRTRLSQAHEGQRFGENRDSADPYGGARSSRLSLPAPMQHRP